MTAELSDVIDAHHHLWDPRLRSYDFLGDLPDIDRPFESSDLSMATAGLGVSATVVVQASGTAEETEWLLDVSARSELIAGVVGWVDLQDPAVGDRLQELAGRSLVGIRHQAQDEPDATWLTRAEVQSGLRALQKESLPFDLLVKRPQRAAALEVAGALPEATFVIDHLGKPDIAAGEWHDWFAWMAAVSAHPNVVCKLSGLVTEASWTAWPQQPLASYITAALDLFSPARCMFGSDWPVSLLAAGYGEVLGLVDEATSHLSSSERQAVFHSTASNTYGLSII